VVFSPPDESQLINAVMGEDPMNLAEEGAEGDEPDIYSAARGHDPFMWRPFNVTLVANQELVWNAGDQPDYFLVTIDNTANTGVQVWPGEAPGGPWSASLSPGGDCRVAGISQYISLRANGVGATVIVVAERGYPMARIKGSA
jgi:hypothetical protein